MCKYATPHRTPAPWPNLRRQFPFPRSVKFHCAGLLSGTIERRVQMSWIKRGLTVAPLVVAACLVVVDPIVARLFLPFREIIAVLVSVQLVVCFLICWRRQPRGRGVIRLVA